MNTIVNELVVKNLCIVLTSSLKCEKYQYAVNKLNVDQNIGLCFTDVDHVYKYLNHGTHIYMVKIPYKEPQLKIYEEGAGHNKIWRTNILYLTNERYYILNSLTLNKFMLPTFKNHFKTYMKMIINLNDVGALTNLDPEFKVLDQKVLCNELDFELLLSKFDIVKYLIENKVFDKEMCTFVERLLFWCPANVTEILNLLNKNKLFKTYIKYWFEQFVKLFLESSFHKRIIILEWFKDNTNVDINNVVHRETNGCGENKCAYDLLVLCGLHLNRQP